AFRGPRPGKPDAPEPDEDAELRAQIMATLADAAKALGLDSETIFNWDAAAAMAKCSSAADYRSICAGEHTTGEPDDANHWALPHHSAPGAGPDKGGVIAALGRWNQTDNLKNKEAALSHLKAHASSLGLPSGDSSDNLPSGIQAWTEATEEEAAAFLRLLKGA